MLYIAGLIEEEDDTNVVEESFRQAYRNSQADTICVPGLQEFAGSVSTSKLTCSTPICAGYLVQCINADVWMAPLNQEVHSADLGKEKKHQFISRPARSHLFRV